MGKKRRRQRAREPQGPKVHEPALEPEAIAVRPRGSAARAIIEGRVDDVVALLDQHSVPGELARLGFAAIALASDADFDVEVSVDGGAPERLRDGERRAIARTQLAKGLSGLMTRALPIVKARRPF